MKPDNSDCRIPQQGYELKLLSTFQFQFHGWKLDISKCYKSLRAQ